MSQRTWFIRLVKLAFVVVMGFCLTVAVSVLAATTVVVKPSSLNNWGFADDNGVGGGTTGFESGPGRHP